MWSIQNHAMHKSHVKTLVLVFAAWKLLLLLGTTASPGPGYDTSTQLLLPSVSASDPLPIRLLGRVLVKLVRWDALYFVNTANRGYLFEQEWAWGSGFTLLVADAARVFSFLSLPPLFAEAIAAILISHFSHLLSVVLLYSLASQILPSDQPRSTAWIAACLHIFSPAGIFMSAPYGESLFSCLNFLGMLICSSAWTPVKTRRSMAADTLSIVAAGACFGFASTVRSNGALSILVFVEPCLLAMKNLFFSVREDHAPKEIVAIALAVLLAASGTILPQMIAYHQYCTGMEPRFWCQHYLPSIYSHVQQYYWNVGFLRYWTLSNLPLFLLAIPMLLMLIGTGLVAITNPQRLLPPLVAPNSEVVLRERATFARCVRRLAIPQIVLAILALFNFHVQIINRIASGYPIWYIAIAIAITNGRNGIRSAAQARFDLSSPYMVRFLHKHRPQQWIVRAMIMYAAIQSGLYASFLPPA